MTGLVSPALAKEIRALLPIWAIALTIVVLSSFGGGFTPGVGLLGFAFGAIALGAQSFGYGSSHRTLVLMLSQPIDRRRLFLYKFGVLLAMLGSLAAATLLLFQDALRLAASPHTEPGMLLLVATSGLCLAPWLTMVCRSPLAGGVFTIAIPGVLAVGSDILGVLIYGADDPAAVDRFSSTVFRPAILLICSLSAAAAWRAFTRLEAIDGAGTEIQLPGALTGASATAATQPHRPQSVLRALVGKELRLQQITFVLASIFVVLWACLVWREHLRPDSPGLPLVSITMLYAGILAVLAGALTSAQERQLGVLEWQTLQPVAAWKQWMLKVGMAWMLVLTFGLAVPMALAYVAHPNERLAPQQIRWLAVAVLTLAALGAYVSSLCKTSVTALVLSVPAVALLGIFFKTMTDYMVILWIRAGVFAHRAPVVSLETIEVLAFGTSAGLIVLLVALAFGNHRRTDSTGHRLLTQVPAIAGYITAAVAVLIALG